MNIEQNDVSGAPLTVGFLRRKLDCEDGITSHCETLIRGLKTQGVNVVMFTGPVYYEPKTKARYDTIRALCSNWVNLDLPARGTLFRRKIIDQLTEEVRTNRVDAIHLHGMGTLPLAKAVGHRCGIPTVATVHLSPRGIGRLSGAVAWLTKPLLSWIWPDRVIAISSELRRTFTHGYGIAESRVEVILNGVSLKHFRPPNDAERQAARAALGIASDEFVILHVGRLAAVKGHDVLIRAMADLRLRHPEIRALFLGTGPDADEIRRLIASHRLEPNITFLGHGEARPAYWAADALALPSRREGFALVVAEAMLCGVIPLRTPAAGAYDQITDGHNGYLFPFEDHGRLAEQLDQLIVDPLLRAQMRSAAIETARQRFDANVMAEKTASVYRELSARSFAIRTGRGRRPFRQPRLSPVYAAESGAV